MPATNRPSIGDTFAATKTEKGKELAYEAVVLDIGELGIIYVKMRHKKKGGVKSNWENDLWERVPPEWTLTGHRAIPKTWSEIHGESEDDPR